MIATQYRLRRWRVQKILKRGKTKKVGLFIVRYELNKKAYHRWALVLSRKFEKLAVKRNRKRRQIYEAIRMYTKGLTPEKDEKSYYDIVLIPYKEILTCKYEKIYQNVKDILKNIV